MILTAAVTTPAVTTLSGTIQLRSPMNVHNTTSRNSSNIDSVKFESIVWSSALFTALSADANGFTDQRIDHVVFALDAFCPMTSQRRRQSNRCCQLLTQDTVCAKLEHDRLECQWLLSR